MFVSFSVSFHVDFYLSWMDFIIFLSFYLFNVLIGLCIFLSTRSRQTTWTRGNDRKPGKVCLHRLHACLNFSELFTYSFIFLTAIKKGEEEQHLDTF